MVPRTAELPPPQNMAPGDEQAPPMPTRGLIF